MTVKRFHLIIVTHVSYCGIRVRRGDSAWVFISSSHDAYAIIATNEMEGEAFEERVIRPTFTDPYTMELLYFYEVVTHNVQPKTSAEDFVHDLELFDMIMNALRK